MRAALSVPEHSEPVEEVAAPDVAAAHSEQAVVPVSVAAARVVRERDALPAAVSVVFEWGQERAVWEQEYQG